MNALRSCIVLGCLLIVVACDTESTETAAPPPAVEAASSELNADGAPSADAPAAEGPLYAYSSDHADLKIFDPWLGDLPGMVERRMVRALVPWSDTYYYLDGPEQRGISFEALTLFEKWLNEELGSGTVRMHVVILPVRRDQMLEFIAEGRGDLALGGITITEQRAELVDFTDPISKEISEWVIEGSTAAPLQGIDDLSGREVHVRASSSYWQSLEALNADFAQRELAPVQLKAADEYLSTEDLMQMANAGAVSYTVADSEIAAFWANAFPDLRVREDIAIREGARYGWVLRKNSPELKSLLNRFVNANRMGTLTANVIINRYLKDTSRLHSIQGEEDQQRMRKVYQYFEAAAPEYEFEALMMLAQGFQESRLDQSRRSHRGAVGIMQLLPSTAADDAVGIDDISTAENNILAGIKYMAWIRDTYFDDPELDGFNRAALAFASYNAGPTRVRGLRERAAARGLDPNVWFDNVELIAAEEIGRETVDYVANIYKYYLAFKLAQEKDGLGHGGEVKQAGDNF
jgi:membrane-bound lytic murein transglycosylase MltF